MGFVLYEAEGGVTYLGSNSFFAVLNARGYGPDGRIKANWWWDKDFEYDEIHPDKRHLLVVDRKIKLIGEYIDEDGVRAFTRKWSFGDISEPSMERSVQSADKHYQHYQHSPAALAFLAWLH